MAWRPEAQPLTRDEIASKIVLTVAEVAATAQVSPNTVYTWVRDGVVPSVKIGNKRFIPADKFLALFSEDAQA